ncbi:MAG: histidine kinase [Bacteroidia bacterium]
MNRLPWILGIISFLVVWHFLTGWYPPLTDGHVWEPKGKCNWYLHSPLPYFTESALQRGDILLRIDYRPICDLRQVPPQGDPHRLYLYEVQRGEAIHLVFVESMSPFLLGWAKSEVEYVWTEWGLLGILIGGVAILLFVREGDIWQIRWITRIGLLGGLVGLGALWLLWAQRRPPQSVIAAQIAVSGWLWWGVFRLLSVWRRAFFFLPAIVLPFVLQGAASYMVAEVILGGGALILPRSYALIYGGGWVGWVVLRSPAFLPFMAGVGMASYLPEMRRSLRLLPPETIALRLLALSIGLGVLAWRETPQDKLLWGGTALAVALFGGEVIRRFIQGRQQRVRFLQERLPQLWERVEKSDLLRFVEETLRAYAGVRQVQVLRSPSEPPAQSWLRRTGDIPPFPTGNLSSMPDAALSLPAYGWLLLWEGEYRLRIDDIHRLVPFAAGLSIALRHAELFEAAHEARLSALRGQLSPHFLFNALNTLQSLVGENPELAEALMSRLGGLLRRTLVHAKQVTTSLQEEIALVQDYLSIEQQRFGKRLLVHLDIPDPLPALEVPPFCIQLLAENVIKHAVSRLTRPVHLTISIREASEKVIIEVIDDGPGIDPAQIGKGVGLLNLTTRLEYLYGKEAKLIAERLTPGTRVSIHLPRPSSPVGVRTHSQGVNPSEREK